MTRYIAIVSLVAVFGWCAPIASVQIPPRPKDSPFTIGITFAPWTEAEWDHFVDWAPVWRVELDQADAVIAHGARALFIAKIEDDASLSALLPYLGRAWGIELGNEPNLSHQAAAVNAWYGRSIATLRAAGFSGLIVTGGVHNIDDPTLRWLQRSIVGLSPDIIIGWHAYNQWQPQLGKLLAVTAGYRHMMTETGYPQDVVTERLVADTAQREMDKIYQSGSLGYFWYQMHDGAPGSNDGTFGVLAFDGHWRPIERILKQ